MEQILRYNCRHHAVVTAWRQAGKVAGPRQCYNPLNPLRHGPQFPARLFPMFSFRQIAGLLLILGFLPALAFARQQKVQIPHPLPVRASAKAQADPVVQPTPPPAPPPTLEQLPAQPPQVSYLNGQLTIISRNSTLGDILHAVARQTGAAIDLPPGAGFERVAGRMGPGPARNVLAELLNGSRYDYVMIAAASNPGGLQHVILTPKTAGSDNPSPAPPVAAYQPQPQPDQQVMPNEPDMTPDASADDQEIPPTEEPQQAPPGEMPPGEPPQKPDYPRAYMPGAQPQPGAQQAPGVKTPEQLLQELQRMQQLQQQQQQQQQQNQPQ